MSARPQSSRTALPRPALVLHLRMNVFLCGCFFLALAVICVSYQPLLVPALISPGQAAGCPQPIYRITASEHLGGTVKNVTHRFLRTPHPYFSATRPGAPDSSPFPLLCFVCLGVWLGLACADTGARVTVQYIKKGASRRRDSGGFISVPYRREYQPTRALCMRTSTSNQSLRTSLHTAVCTNYSSTTGQQWLKCRGGVLLNSPLIRQLLTAHLIPHTHMASK